MHNPMLEGDAISEIEHPYFEFIKQEDIVIFLEEQTRVIPYGYFTS